MSRTLIERWWPWVLRVCWGVLPFSLGALLGDVLSDQARSVQLVGTGLAWLLWGIGLLGTLVPHPAGLVALRTLSYAGVLAAIVSLTAEGGSAFARVAGPVAALVAFGVALYAETGHWAVNGPAYGNERRYLLRPSALIATLAVPVVSTLWVGSVIGGPLLLADRRWGLGAPVCVLAIVLSYVIGRALYALARRFVVFVPAGFVVHDPAVLADPVLFRSAVVEAIRPAPADTDSLDLTNNAPGLAVEVLLREKVEITRAAPRNTLGPTGRTARFLIVPTRPGRLLTDAATRRYSVS